MDQLIRVKAEPFFAFSEIGQPVQSCFGDSQRKFLCDQKNCQAVMKSVRRQKVRPDDLGLLAHLG